MTHPLDDLLARVPFAVLDGALASELENRGCRLNDALWSARVLAEQPELIAQVHRDYFDAGADIGISASYQASLAGYAQAGIKAERARQLMAESATLLHQARDAYRTKNAEHTLPMTFTSALCSVVFLYKGGRLAFKGRPVKKCRQPLSFCRSHRPPSIYQASTPLLTTTIAGRTKRSLRV